MKARINYHFKYIKQHISSSNNQQAAWLDLHDEKAMAEFKAKVDAVKFTRAIRKLLFFDMHTASLCLSGTGTDGNMPMITLFSHVLVAFLVEIYKTGKCGEQASLGLVRFLKTGIKDNVKIISMKGTDHNDGEGDHSFLVLGLDPKADTSKPITWRNFTKFDTWADPAPITYRGNELMTPEALQGSIFKTVTNIKEEFQWRENLTSEDCDKIIAFLENIKKLFTEKFLLLASNKSGRISIDLEKELAVIHKKIEEEIACFARLKKFPPVSPEAFIVTHYGNRYLSSYLMPLDEKRSDKQFATVAGIPGKFNIR